MGRWWRYKWITFHPSLTLIRKTWEKIATEILSLNVITPAFEKLRWKSNLGKPPCPELIPEMLS
ncbi:hypothetical protein DP934_22220 [Escherichia coli]|nr:hypothetical protein CEQ26_04900 [Escherichia coli O104:H4]ATG06375.1 hypothetical protein CO703_12485 [Escherichia coli]EFB5453951.1 hypothetical protein [Escherichia coli O157]EFP9424179.1 hypothetical protein [Shigella dysenteriae]EFW7473604.1 hypothetical protein [Shigella sonnei]QKI49156.1 hypothetical protein FVP48_06625 [Escherichia coli O10:H32]